MSKAEPAPVPAARPALVEVEKDEIVEVWVDCADAGWYDAEVTDIDADVIIVKVIEALPFEAKNILRKDTPPARPAPGVVEVTKLRYSAGRDATAPNELLVCDHKENEIILRGSMAAFPKVKELIDRANCAHLPAGAGAAMELVRRMAASTDPLPQDIGLWMLEVEEWLVTARRLVAAAEGEGKKQEHP